MKELISTTRFLTRRLADSPPFDPETGGQYPVFEGLPFGKNREERRRFVHQISREKREALVQLLLQADRHTVAFAQAAVEAAQAKADEQKLVLPQGVLS